MKHAEVATSFTVAQVAALVDLRSPMIDYLYRRRVVLPSVAPTPGRGNPRLYSFGDVVMLRAVKRLLDSGMSVERLKMGLEKLRSLHADITPTSLPGRYLLSDGRDLYFKSSVSELENVSADGQFVFGFCLEFARVRDEVVLRLAQRVAGS